MSRNDIIPEWKKLERDLGKIGLKDGLSDGRDSNFQGSFDNAYKDGFANGFILGQLKFKREMTDNPLLCLNQELKGPASSGMCIICSKEKANDNVADVREKQLTYFRNEMANIKENKI